MLPFKKLHCVAADINFRITHFDAVARCCHVENYISNLEFILIMDKSFKSRQQELEKSLSMLESDALNFAVRFINDSKVRKQYMSNIKNLSAEYRQRVKMGALTPKAAAEEVNLLRNDILRADRLKLSEVGVSYSEKLKLTGYTLSNRMEYYANKLFKLPFNELTVSQQNQVYLEIVQGGGRSFKTTNILARRLSRLGRGLLVITVGIVIYNITTADDKLKATAEEGAVLSGGILGGASGGAIAGLACGPGAPVCVSLGVFIGGALGALGAGFTFDWLY